MANTRTDRRTPAYFRGIPAAVWRAALAPGRRDRAERDRS
jgi:hypothetical protein